MRRVRGLGPAAPGTQGVPCRLQPAPGASLMRVKPLITNANPVPDAAHGTLSARAADELATLVGPDGTPPPAAPRRSPRRGYLMAAVACGAAVAVGAVTLLSLPGDPAGPSGHQAARSSGPAGAGEGTDGGLSADEPYFGSTAELERAAHVIVRARLGSGHEETGGGVRTTVATAKVVATAKGETPGDAIRVSYTTPGSGPETAGLSAGKEYVLLLDKGEGGDYVLVNTTQGWYEVEGGAAVAAKDNGVALSPAVRKALRLAPRGR
ncbi:LigA protein [Streptomyces sp. NRRL B-3648]|nr:LigA protein [Streptomyces sp. NRRL B-3648]